MERPTNRPPRPARDAVSPDDIAATIYTLLGIPPETEILDPLQRPHRLALGQPIKQLLPG